MGATAPLAGLRVVEVALGASAVGVGMATNLPGALMRDLGADVVRVHSSRRSTLDAGIEFERAWNRGKELVDVDDEAAGSAVAAFGARRRRAVRDRQRSRRRAPGSRLRRALAGEPPSRRGAHPPERQRTGRAARPRAARRRSRRPSHADSQPRRGPGLPRLARGRRGRGAHGHGRRDGLPLRTGGDRRRRLGRDVALRRSVRPSSDDHRARRAPVGDDQPALARPRPRRGAVVPLRGRRVRPALVRRERRLRGVPRARRRPAQ